MVTGKLLPKEWIILLIMTLLTAPHVKSQNTILELDANIAAQLSRIPMGCLQQEYPNKLNQVLGKETDLQSPRNLHPSFYGCFDWHSSVHGHWMLVKLLKLFPDLEDRDKIISTIDQNLSKENLEEEVLYFDGKHNATFERTYGWAWLLKLTEEIRAWEDPIARKWGKNLTPLADLIREKYMEFLPKLTYPIRTGEHPNTAFGLALAYDYAYNLKDTAFLELIISRGRDYYLNDKNCPVNWEPNGFDFLSPCLEEANFMQKILTKEEFQSWMGDFIPDFSSLSPAMVSDRSDPKIVHLDGLNFSRTWCLFGISKSLDDLNKEMLIRLAADHFNTSFPHLSSGNYEGEHWLTSFAILALTQKP